MGKLTISMAIFNSKLFKKTSLGYMLVYDPNKFDSRAPPRILASGLEQYGSVVPTTTFSR